MHFILQINLLYTYLIKQSYDHCYQYYHRWKAGDCVPPCSSNFMKITLAVNCAKINLKILKGPDGFK